MKIIKLDELSLPDLSEVIKVFFQTSSVHSFSTDEDKELFLYRYFGYYQEHYPQFFFVAIEGDKPVGYICGSDSSFEDKDLLRLQPQVEYFEAECVGYPAHLHININPEYHGKGIGRKLMDIFHDTLSDHKVAGLHIVTTPKSDNVKFYRACGFDFECMKTINEIELLFMAKLIKSVR